MGKLLYFNAYKLKSAYCSLLASGFTPILYTDKVSFNVSPQAVRDLKFDKDNVTFKASFGGEILNIKLPMNQTIGLKPLEDLVS